MKRQFQSLSDLLAHGADTVIDVRSPSEFAEDHIPGAINLPVLSDAERAKVGTIYVQQSAFLARKIGAALVAQNSALHLQGPLADKDGAWKPLVYCWRGGQRSGSFATILAQVGWRVGLIEGGYQSWRRLVHRALYDDPIPVRVVLLDGLTGTAKTDILHRFAAQGGQMIDLEGLANHRGSLLGGRPEGQPSQKAFESRLATALAGLDPARPVLIEAESNKIGDLHVPPTLWEAMKSAPALRIEAPLAARADYLTEAYADMVEDRAALVTRLDKLRQLRGGEAYGRWCDLLDDGDFRGLARCLMAEHYDPAYTKSRAAHERPEAGVLYSATLTPEDRDQLAGALLTRLSSEHGDP
ncbi:MAG: tRNA 2-selenouridine(34) synthase MnmH [Rhodobacterales bacterium]|nr:MAG: tRNA 2-selenouridine(34) synthase MnmH [Rhodobacterales bacterium]